MGLIERAKGSVDCPQSAVHSWAAAGRAGSEGRHDRRDSHPRPAHGFGVHVANGYIYAAMAFSALVEGLNMMARCARARKQAAVPAQDVAQP